MGEGKTKKLLSGKPLLFKREFSAGGVVYKKENNEVVWLVAKSSPSKKFPGEFWRLPKGWLDDEDGKVFPGPLAQGFKKANPEEIETAALREVKEEGGVEAKIISKVGTIRYFTSTVQGPVLKFVTFYLMEWIKDLPEGYDNETSEVAWLPFKEARAMLSRDREKQILEKAKEILERPRQESLV